MLCGLLTAKRKVIGKWDYWLCLLVGSTILALGLCSKGYWMFGKTWAAHPRQNFLEYLWKKNNLIQLCQAFDLCIMNGRIGSDKFIGFPTCRKSLNSVVDYVIVNDAMIPYVTDVQIEMFDQCMSDVHCPVLFHLSIPLSENSTCITYECQNHEIDQSGKECPNRHLMWSPEIATAFNENLTDSCIEILETNLEILSGNTTQTGIDKLCTEMSEIIIKAAEASRAYKGIRKGKMNNKNVKNVFKPPRKPWFDEECAIERKKYYKIKNFLKRNGERNMSHKESKKFKKFMKCKEKKYFKDLNQRIRNLKSTNPKEYWNLLNKSTDSSKEQVKISLETFRDHFQKLSSNGKENRDGAADDTSDPQKIQCNVNDELDVDFTIEEIYNNIKNLKNNKACGLDFIRNEFLKNLSPRLLSFTCALFNLILKSGIIPDAWCIGMIMPLYKRKGHRDDPNNFRGITLLSCFGKLFTACLNTRIANFLFKYDKIGAEQAGFRPGFSVLDHIFTLHSIIEFYKSKKQWLYCAFVDYSKAFDLIDRSALWHKILQHGINGRVFQVVYNIYQKTKSCVKSGGKISDFFSCNTGVRQGENLSPILFAMYVNDFQESIGKCYKGLDLLNEYVSKELDTFLKLYLLLYADDTIIMAETAGELQLALNALQDYCDKWSLSVNTDKTKIVIFSRGKVTKYPNFYLGKTTINVEKEYTYLGVIFNYNGLFNKAIDKQIAQAKKAMFALLEKAKALKLPVDITCELFDRTVTPVLLYGCEVWGPSDIRNVEIFHRSFLRILLKTYKFTPNCMLYGETGVTDMSTTIKCRIINFWAKLKFGDHNKFSSIMYCLLDKLHHNSPDVFNFKWIEYVKNVLNNAGFSELWHAEGINSESLKYYFKQRCNDIFKQNWYSEVQNNSQCSFYRKIKDTHQFESYLNELEPVDRYAICKLRTRTHHLPVTKARFQRSNSDSNTFCTLCSLNETGDELHYMFKCPYFLKEQRKYIPEHLLSYNPESAISSILASEYDTLRKFAKFVKIILSTFKYASTKTAGQLPRGKKPKFSRSGREIIPPSKLNL